MVGDKLLSGLGQLNGLCPSIINHVIIHGFYALDSKLPSFSLPLDLQFLSVCGCNFCPIYLSISNLSLSVLILSVVPIFSVVPISRGSDLLCGSDLPNPSFYLSIWNFSLCVPIFSVGSSELNEPVFSVLIKLNRLTKIGCFFSVEIVSVCRSQFRLHFRSSNQVK
ncbi:hypothetical protein LXL04_022479 [Taraxacum kok-saghyz]